MDLHHVTLPSDPEEALAAVVALRRLADRLEQDAVRSAVESGWSWSMIAEALGITRQAAHKRLSGMVRANRAAQETDIDV